MNEFGLKLKLDLDSKDSVNKLKKDLLSMKVPTLLDMLTGKKNGSGKTVGEHLSAIFDKALASLKSIVSDSLDELKDLGSYSRMTDSHVRDLKLGYGLSSSQAYGYDKAMGMLGIESMDDLMWADSQQLSEFKRLFEKYTEYYEETMTPEYIQKQLEYQIAMDEFKQDLKNSVITFFMDNKDTIMSLMDTAMTFMDFTMDVIGDILHAVTEQRGRTEEERARETEEFMNSYLVNNKSSNVTQNNTFNGVSEKDKTWLQNSQQLAYKQLVDQYNQS